MICAKSFLHGLFLPSHTHDNTQPPIEIDWREEYFDYLYTNSEQYSK